MSDQRLRQLERALASGDAETQRTHLAELERVEGVHAGLAALPLRLVAGLSGLGDGGCGCHPVADRNRQVLWLRFALLAAWP